VARKAPQLPPKKDQPSAAKPLRIKSRRKLKVTLSPAYPAPKPADKNADLPAKKKRKRSKTPVKMSTLQKKLSKFTYLLHRQKQRVKSAIM